MGNDNSKQQFNKKYNKDRIDRHKNLPIKFDNHIIYKIDDLPYNDYRSDRGLIKLNKELLTLNKKLTYNKKKLLTLNKNPNPVQTNDIKENINDIKENINDIKENINVIKEINKDTVYFHLEKLTNENKQKWLNIIESIKSFPKKLNTIDNNGNIITIDGLNIQSGFAYFIDSVMHPHGPLGSNDHDLYIAYTSIIPDIRGMQDIEMIFTVLVKDRYHITTHMGIFKNPDYLTNDAYWGNTPPTYRYPKTELQKKFHTHPKLSIYLHVFAGCIIKKLYPNIKGMITSPTQLMLDILIKALGSNVYGVEDMDTEEDIVYDKETDGLSFKHNGTEIAKITKQNLIINGGLYPLPHWECGQLYNNDIPKEDNALCYSIEHGNQSIFIPYETFKILFDSFNFTPIN